MLRRFFAGVFGFSLVAHSPCVGGGPGTAQAQTQADANGPISFREDVAPILVKSCLGCHNAQKAEGGLSLATFATLRNGGDSGGKSIVEPGDPDASQLIELVRPEGEPRMPYKQPPLNEAQVRTLERWIKQGARFDGPSETETPLASLVDPLKDLPRVVVEAPVSEALTAVAYAPDGKTVAAAAGRDVRLFQADSDQLVATLAGHPGPLTTVLFTPDGRTLIAAGGRPGLFGSVTVWDLAARTRRIEFRGHADSILGAALSPNGLHLATASYDRKIKLWDLAQGRELRTLSDHTDAVYGVAFAPDGRLLASAAADRTVKLWDVDSGRRLKTLSDATAELYTVTFNGDGKTIFAGGVDRSIHAWSLSRSDGGSPTTTEATLRTSVFAHDAPVLRLAVTPDGKTLISSGEDRVVKLWDLPGLKARAALTGQADWPQGLAVSPDSRGVAVGRFDGSLSVFETASGKPQLALKPSPEPSVPVKPSLVRNASLNPPSPRGGVRGSTLKLVLSGNGVGRATAVVFNQSGLTGTILRSSKPDPNRLEAELKIAPDARVGIHKIGVLTPLGVTPFQPFLVSAFPEVAEPAAKAEAAGLKPVKLPAMLTGAIETPGDSDRFLVEAKAGDQLVFASQAKPLGSPLRCLLTLEDDQGVVLGEAAPGDDASDPVLVVPISRDGPVTLTVSDADFAGTSGHFYRIATGRIPYLTDLFPLGIGRAASTGLSLHGANLQGVSSVRMEADTEDEAGSTATVPVALPEGLEPINRRSVVFGDGDQHVESSDNDLPDRAEPIPVPGGVSGRIERAGDVDLYRFQARKGNRVILEVFGRRLGTSIDPVLEVLDDQGRPVPRAVLRALDQTEVAFRDHDSTKPGIRLTRWGNLALGDFVLIGRELARIRALPRNPDDDCLFWSEKNQRVAFLGTTPEHHPMAQPVYKVSIHSPGVVFPPGGVPPVTLTYRNDDGGPDTSKDSRLTFDPPSDGTYLVRVADVRGLGGDGFGYHLLVRRPRPRFRLALSPENPSVPRGGTALVTATITRLDEFDGAVDLEVDGLPPGVTATRSRIERDDVSASLALTADLTAPAFSPPTWRVTGRATATDEVLVPAGASDQVQVVDPGGASGGWIVVSPEPNLEVRAPRRVAIRPGEQVELRLSVVRGPAFAGRVPIDVRNLPQGVRVLNIGLNGVLIPESQTERTVFLYAEPWVGSTERPFFAVGKAEAAGTEHSSAPIELTVGPKTGPISTSTLSPASTTIPLPSR